MIPVISHTFVEIDREIISTVILLFTDLRRVVVSIKWEYVHQVLESHIIKLDHEKVSTVN